MLRHFLLVHLGNFQVVAEHAVVAHLQGGNARFLALPRLQRGDDLLAVARQLAKCVQLCDDALADVAALAELEGRFLEEALAQKAVDVLHRVQPLGQVPQQLRAQLAQQGRQKLDATQRLAQRQHIRDSGLGQVDAADDALHIPNPREHFAQRVTAHLVIGQLRHGRQAGFDGRAIQQGLGQPAPQQAGPHRRAGQVQQGEQRVLPAPRRPVIENFQVLQRGLVQPHRLVGQAGPQRRQVGQIGLLGMGQVGQQRARRAQGGVHVFHAESGQARRLELLGEPLFRAPQLEPCPRHPFQAHGHLPACLQAALQLRLDGRQGVPPLLAANFRQQNFPRPFHRNQLVQPLAVRLGKLHRLEVAG